jgi:hypothetical protein
MYRNASVQLLQSFQPEEFKAFADYLGKAIPKTNQEFILFKYLKKHYPDFKEEDLEMGKVLKQLFKKDNTSGNRKWLSNLMHKLSKFITDFLIDQEVKNSPRERDYLLGQSYRRLGQQDLLAKLIDDYQELPQEGTSKSDSPKKELDIWLDWNLLRLHLLLYFSRGTLKTAKGEDNLKKSYTALEKSYLVVKLKLMLEMETLKRINGSESLATDTIEELELQLNRLDKIPPLAQLYFQAYKMLIEPNDATFYKFKTLVFQLWQQLDHSEYSNLLNALINYAAFAIKARKNEFYKEAADLFQKGLETRALIQDDQISPELLMSCVSSFCEIGQIEKAIKIFNDWKSSLPPSMKKEAIRAIEARLFFYQKRYDQVNKLFYSDKKPSNHLLEMGLRVTFIQSLYELEDTDRLTKECENLEKLLKRNKEHFSEQHFNGYLNFSEMVLNLVKAKQTNKKSGLAKKLDNYRFMVCNTWFLEKVKALEG